MKVALIGATGFVGSQLLNEALQRGHEVTAIVRRIERLPRHPNLTAKTVDILDIDALAAVLAGHDAVIAAFNPDRTMPGDVFERMVEGARAIIAATKKAGVKRLLAVGGAGSLQVAPGHATHRSPRLPAGMEGPERAAPGSSCICSRKSPISTGPSSARRQRSQPGERTGTFRLGGDQLLVDDKGECRISTADYAVAMIDELEEPEHTRAGASA